MPASAGGGHDGLGDVHHGHGGTPGSPAMREDGRSGRSSRRRRRRTGAPALVPSAISAKPSSHGLRSCRFPPALPGPPRRRRRRTARRCRGSVQSISLVISSAPMTSAHLARPRATKPSATDRRNEARADGLHVERRAHGTAQLALDDGGGGGEGQVRRGPSRRRSGRHPAVCGPPPASARVAAAAARSETGSSGAALVTWRIPVRFR